MEQFNTVEPYFPDDATAAHSMKVYQNYQHCISLRDQTYPEFDDLKPEDYWSEARKRVKNYLPPLSADVELANIFFGRTRNKRNAIAAFVASQRPRVEISVQGGNNSKKSDKRIADMLTTAYDFFMEKENADEIYLDWTIETLDVGTGYIQESYDFRVRDVKTAIEEDHGTGKVTWKKEQRPYKDQPKSTIIPVEDVFIPDFYQYDIQEQPYVIVREYIPRVIAEQRYKSHPNWKYVPISTRAVDEKESDTFFFQLLQDRVEDYYVEVIHYINKWDDLYTIHCNGVPVTDIDRPIPFDHKEYPFAKNCYEKIGNFTYGMALPMKIVSEQDAFNEIGNNNMDRSRASSVPRLVADYDTEIEQDYMGANEIIMTDRENGLRELNFNPVKAGDMQFAQFIGEMIDEATVDRSFTGAVEGVTAAEIMNAKAQNQQNLGPFLTYIYAAAKKHAELKLSTIMQYYFLTNKKYNNKKFDTKEIVFNQKLQDGIDGIRIIRIVSDRGKIPRKSEYLSEHAKGIVEKMNAKGEKERRVETNYDIIYITPEEIADIQYKVKIIPGSSLPETQSLKKALAIELSNTMAQPQFSGLTDFNKLQQMIVETFGYSIDDIRPDNTDQDALKQGQIQEGAEQQQAMGNAGNQGQGNNSELIANMTGTSTGGMMDQLAP